MYENVRQFIQSPQTMVVPEHGPVSVPTQSSPELCGMLRGTRVATAAGWRPVESIAVGDAVMTFDHGLRPVQAIRRGKVFLSGSDRDRQRMPLFVPADAVGNRLAVVLPPDQAVLLESDLAEALHGDPFALVPAAALEGHMGIERFNPGEPLELIQLGFAAPEVIYASGSMMVHCGTEDDAATERAGYEVLSREAARPIVETLLDETVALDYAVAAE